MDFLLNLDLKTYTHFIYFWGFLGVLSAMSVLLTGMLPISGRKETAGLAFLGTIDKKLGWIIMEVPILIAVIGFYIAGSDSIDVSAIIVGAFVFHYANRALIYPQPYQGAGKTMPVSMVLTTMIFYTINGYLLGYYFGALRSYSIEWLWDPRFILGMSLFLIGFIINVKSDTILINLRKPGETGYRIPRGGLFRLVSCPNYFGEIVEWLGFAIMSWSLPGAMYALWVSLALLATGLGTHRWYREQFGQDYPPERKAVIPYVF